MDQIRDVFTDSDEWLTGREIVARINGLASVDFLGAGDEFRRWMRQLVADGMFEEEKIGVRYSYRPIEELTSAV